MITPRVALLAACSLPLALACAGVKMNDTGGGGRGGASSSGRGGAGSGGSRPGSGFGGGVGGGDCVGLECFQTTCKVNKCSVPACGESSQSRETTLSGTVYDPAGKVPLYNVVVYVPNAALSAIPEGLSCQQCAGNASGKPLVSALTDAAGHFVLKNVPVGKDVPLVLQVGKWRRQITLPEIFPCQENKLEDANLLRLPRNKAEGNIPQIALSTGHSDALDCLLRKIGIADEEFTTDAGTGRVHMYAGAAGVVASDHGVGANQFVSGQKFADAYSTLLAKPDKLAKYDIIVLQCEGQSPDTDTYPYSPNLMQYTGRGGRLFAEHVHAAWIKDGVPPWPATGEWMSGPDLPSPTMSNVETSFPKGAALADWLVAVGATPTRGLIQLTAGQNSVNAVYAPTQRWIYTTSPATTQYLTFNAPIEAAPENQCGRVVFTDIHVSAGGGSSHPETPFPTGCTGTTLSAQEKALEFMFFDLSSCIMEEHSEPQPPVP